MSVLHGMEPLFPVRARNFDLLRRGCWFYWPALLAVGLLFSGCTGQPYRTAERLQRRLVIVLPGIEGRSRHNEDICKGLDAGGVDWAIEIYDWTRPLGPLYNLRAEGENRRKATELAWRIARYHWDYPGRPVVLVGQSGGGAMAIWAAEALLAGQKVEGIILLAASLSPSYMLDFSLPNTHRGILNFYSPRDWVFLGVGTTVYGTMDGQHTASAGQIGFAIPETPQRAEAYQQLFQIAWRPEMTDSGHPGMHVTSGAMDFVAEYVAPFILAEPQDVPWDGELIRCVLNHEGFVPLAPPTPPVPEPMRVPTPAAASQPTSSPSSLPASAGPIHPSATQPADKETPATLPAK